MIRLSQFIDRLFSPHSLLAIHPSYVVVTVHKSYTDAALITAGHLRLRHLSQSHTNTQTTSQPVGRRARQDENHHWLIVAMRTVTGSYQFAPTYLLARLPACLLPIPIPAPSPPPLPPTPDRCPFPAINTYIRARHYLKQCSTAVHGHIIHRLFDVVPWWWWWPTIEWEDSIEAASTNSSFVVVLPRAK